MNDETVSVGRRAAWKPPERPEWVETVNREGRNLDLSTIVPLNAESLIEAACRSTGLSDFGAGDWEAPFRVLVKALEEEADLHFIGRVLTRNDLVQFLSARLQVEDTYKRHPEIENELIDAPLLIIGQGRSGTSFLNNLLALDPDNHALITWEAMFPAPPPEPATYHTDPRIRRANNVFDLINRVTPEVAAVHEFSATVPIESIMLVALNFVGDWLPGVLGQVPTFQAYAAPLIKQGLIYEKRVLKLLQWRNPRKRWMLKSPSALAYLPKVLEVYPDMRIGWAHRDPLKALASVVGLQGTLNWVRSDRSFLPGAHEQYLDSRVMGAILSKPIQLIEQGVIRKDRIGHVKYNELMRDPVAAVAKLYADLGFEFTDAARQNMTRYMAEHPREARPAHRYDIGSSSEVAEDRSAFAAYSSYFGIENES